MCHPEPTLSVPTAERRFVWYLVACAGQALDRGYYRLAGVPVLGPPWPGLRVGGRRSALAAIERDGDGNLDALLIRLVGLAFMFDTAVVGRILVADWAYDSNALREGLAARGA